MPSLTYPVTERAEDEGRKDPVFLRPLQAHKSKRRQDEEPPCHAPPEKWELFKTYCKRDVDWRNPSAGNCIISPSRKARWNCTD